MSDPCAKNDELVGEFIFVSGDKCYVSINDNDVVINVDTNSCYRVIIYKVNPDFSF